MRRAIAIFLVSLRTLEDLLDGLEKSQARAASFPLVPNFIVGFMCANPVDWDKQLPVGHVSRLFRVASFFFSFHSFGFLSSPHSPLFLMASHTTYVCLFGRTRVLRPRYRVVKHYVRAF